MREAKQTTRILVSFRNRYDWWEDWRRSCKPFERKLWWTIESLSFRFHRRKVCSSAGKWCYCILWSSYRVLSSSAQLGSGIKASIELLLSLSWPLVCLYSPELPVLLVFNNIISIYLYTIWLFKQIFITYQQMLAIDYR